MSKVTNLHEHLAAEKNLTNKMNILGKETNVTFGDKSSFFDGQIKIYKPQEEDGLQLPEQSVRLRASVVEKLKYLNKHLANFFDFKVTKEITNTFAKADLVYNGTTIMENVPATALLALENNLSYMRDIYKQIPTRDISEDWSFDSEKNVFKGTMRTSDRTEKEQDWKVIVPATDKHPAQVKEIVRTNVLGHWETTPISGRISTIEKAALLQNIDAMIIAVKQARARANKQEIVNSRIGTTILDAIFNGVVQNEVVVDKKEIDAAGL